MSRTKSHTRRSRRATGGFTLAETLISIALVGGLLAVALNTVGAATTGQQRTGDRSHGQLLAMALMCEILQQSYEDPDETPAFGGEPSDTGSGRSGFDDVDDYHAWNSSPPQLRNGTAFAGDDGWTRSVTLEFADPSDLNQPSAGDSGVKRITVTVSRNYVVVATLVAVSTGAAESAGILDMSPMGGGSMGS